MEPGLASGGERQAVGPAGVAVALGQRPVVPALARLCACLGEWVGPLRGTGPMGTPWGRSCNIFRERNFNPLFQSHEATTWQAAAPGRAAAASAKPSAGRGCSWERQALAAAPRAALSGSPMAPPAGPGARWQELPVRSLPGGLMPRCERRQTRGCSSFPCNQHLECQWKSGGTATSWCHLPLALTRALHVSSTLAQNSESLRPSGPPPGPSGPVRYLLIQKQEAKLGSAAGWGGARPWGPSMPHTRTGGHPCAVALKWSFPGSELKQPLPRQALCSRRQLLCPTPGEAAADFGLLFELWGSRGDPQGFSKVFVSHRGHRGSVSSCSRCLVQLCGAVTPASSCW